MIGIRFRAGREPILQVTPLTLARIRFQNCAALILCALLVCPAFAAAWGREAHEMITAAAIRTLPEPLRGYFHGRQFYLVEHASDPDALASENPAERRHHFADVDAYAPYPFVKFRRQFVVERRPPTQIESKHGDAMWQIEFFTLRLASDFREARWQAASQDAVFLAHYAADLTQPLHTVSNYDGQKTGQNGIHRRFETGVVRLDADQWVLHPRPAGIVIHLRQRIFKEFLASYTASRAVFAADKQARSVAAYDSPQFLPDFSRLAGPVAERQIEDAASFVGSLWYTAWVKAGKPDLKAWDGAPRQKSTYPISGRGSRQDHWRE